MLARCCRSRKRSPRRRCMVPHRALGRFRTILYCDLSCNGPKRNRSLLRTAPRWRSAHRRPLECIRPMRNPHRQCTDSPRHPSRKSPTSCKIQTRSPDRLRRGCHRSSVRIVTQVQTVKRIGARRSSRPGHMASRSPPCRRDRRTRNPLRFPHRLPSLPYPGHPSGLRLLPRRRGPRIRRRLAARVPRSQGRSPTPTAFA